MIDLENIQFLITMDHVCNNKGSGEDDFIIFL